MASAETTARLRGLRHVILDLDGTVYLDDQLFNDSIWFLESLATHGITFTYITNNNSRSRAEYVEFMHRLGLPVTPNQLFTSAHATFDYLSQQLPQVSRPHVLGTTALHEEFQMAGFEPGGDSPDAVVVGFASTLTYSNLAETAYWITQGLPYLATHPDRVCPTKQATILPDCGAICALLESATGRVPDAIPGKPSPSMLLSVLRKHNVEPHEAAMIGDRLYTDMKMARTGEVLAVLTLTGETTQEDLDGATVSPDVVVDNLTQFMQLIEKAC